MTEKIDENDKSAHKKTFDFFWLVYANSIRKNRIRNSIIKKNRKRVDQKPRIYLLPLQNKFTYALSFYNTLSVKLIINQLNLFTKRIHKKAFNGLFHIKPK